MNKSILSERTNNAEGLKMVFKQKALMPYMTAGDPDLAMTEEIILTLDKSGADLIEIGIPF